MGPFLLTRRPRSQYGERAAAMLEFAIGFPLLALLMLAVVDFGVDYGNRVQSSHAAREGARSGSVGRIGADGSCFVDGIPVDLRTNDLVCLIKRRTHVDPTRVRVRISYMDGDGKYTNDFSENARLANKYSIMVCVSTAAYSLSGMLGPVFNGKFHHARSVIKTGTTPWSSTATNGATVYDYVGEFAERPVAGDSWAWCRSDDPTADRTL